MIGVKCLKLRQLQNFNFPPSAKKIVMVQCPHSEKEDYVATEKFRYGKNMGKNCGV